MAYSIAVIQGTLDSTKTAGQTQDVTKSGFGTPKGAIFICTRGVTNGTRVDHSALMMGFAGENSTLGKVVSEGAVDNVGTSNTRTHMEAGVIRIILGGSDTPLADADFDSFITDGVRIKWVVPPTSDYLITIILFGGDIDTYEGCALSSGTSDVEVDITGLGFKPDVIFGNASDFNCNAVNLSGVTLSYGFCSSQTGLAQGSINTVDRDNVSTTERSIELATNYINDIGEVLNPSATATANEITDVHSDGFKITQRAFLANPNGVGTRYLAIGFRGQADVSTVEMTYKGQPTGTKAYTGAGFTPVFVMILCSNLAEYNTRTTASVASYHGIGAFTAVSGEEYVNGAWSRDNRSTADTKCVADNKALLVMNPFGSIDIEAVFSSMDSDGFTLNFTNTGPTRLALALCIGDRTKRRVIIDDHLTKVRA